MAVAQAVAHEAKELGAALRVVAGVVGTARVPLEPRYGDGFGEHRLSERRTGECCGVEARERMKRIALDLRARDCCVQEAQVERGVVADQDRAAAAVGTQRVTDLAEDPLQGIALRQRRTQRVKGIDARDRERGGIEPPAFERLDVEVMSGAAFQAAVAVHVDEHRRDLEQRIGRRVKAAGLHVDGHRQVAAEAPRHERRGRRRGCRSRAWLAHWAALGRARRQAMRSPARSGTSSSAPNG